MTADVWAVPESMRAAIIDEIGARPEVKRIDVPRRAPGQALVRIDFAALQPVELFIASGRFYDGPPQVPYVPGLEAVGTVVAGDRLAPRDRVRVEIVHPGYGIDGCFAEYVVVSEAEETASRASRSRVEPLRTDLPDVVIAAVGSSGATARLVVDRAMSEYGSLEGSHVAVLGATGAVGEILVQLCSLAGASRIVAAGRNRERLNLTQKRGAHAAVELRRDADLQSVSDEIRSAADGRLDIVFDPLWGEPAAAALDAMGEGGVLVNFGQSAGTRAPMSGVPLRARRVTIVGHSGARATTVDLKRATESVLDEVAAERVVTSYEVVPLEDLGDAWQRQAASPGTKLVIAPGR